MKRQLLYTLFLFASSAVVATDTIKIKMGDSWEKNLDPNTSTHHWVVTGYAKDLLYINESESEGDNDGILFTVRPKKPGRTNLKFEFRPRRSKRRSPAQPPLEYYVQID